jgi:rhodanese-related sulfurtransferase
VKKFFKISRRSVLGILTAVSAFAFVTAMGQLSLSSDNLTDTDKRRKIEKMYDAYRQEFSEVKDISPQEAMTLADGRRVVFIDVRKPGEQQISMLPGAITDQEFLNDPEKYNDYVKIGYCTISYRSGIFVQRLREIGIPAYNLRGGMLAWIHDGGKIYDQKGETRRIHIYAKNWDLGPNDYEAVQ